MIKTMIGQGRLLTAGQMKALKGAGGSAGRCAAPPPGVCNTQADGNCCLPCCTFLPPRLFAACQFAKATNPLCPLV